MVRRSFLPWVGGIVQSRMVTSGSGCLGSACNILFSGFGRTEGKLLQKAKPLSCRNSITEGFFHQNAIFCCLPSLTIPASST